MKTKLWSVRFNVYDRITVKASNVNLATKKAVSKLKGEWRRRIQDITQVDLLAEED